MSDRAAGTSGLLAGRTAVVTAAAGTGIGRATAERLIDEGAVVVVSDRHEARLATVSAELGVVGIPCDVTDEAAVRHLVSDAIEQLGRIDVWINNAGLGDEAEVVDITDAAWERVLDVNLTGTFRCTRAVLPHMYAQGSGMVVNNASVLGWRAQRGQAHYAAAKAGVMAFTRCVALEAAGHGVRVNAVAPSLAQHANLGRVVSEAQLTAMAEREVLGRAAHPREIANVIVFLASDLSSYLTGEVVSASSQHP